MALGRQDTIAARSAIARGDLNSLERYLREGGAAETASITSSTSTASSVNAGKVILLNLAAGITVTLPNATGTLERYIYVVGTTFTGSGIIKVSRSADTMAGTAVVSSATGATFVTGSASDTITMNGTTTGGLAGSRVELFDAATNMWIVNCVLVASGTAATPFSATV